MNRSLLFIAILSLVLSVIAPMAIPTIGQGDFIAYWSAAHLIIQGQNPYDPNIMFAIQTSNSINIADPSAMQNVWNPPWLLAFFLPFGLLPFKTASMIWMWLIIFFIGLCVYISIGMTKGRRNERLFIWFFIICLFFGPVLALLKIGQVSILILLSLIGCLYFFDKKNDALAGAILLMALIKPHIVFFVFPVIVWRAFRLRRWWLFVGMICASIVSVLLIMLFFPEWPSAYVTLLGKMHVSDWFASTLWSFLNVVFNLKLLPWTGLLLLPLVFWIEAQGSRWGNLTVLNLSLLISVSFAPYGFLFDQAVLIPVLVQVLDWIVSKQISRSAAWIGAFGLVGLYAGLYFLISMDNLPYYFFFWVPFALLAIYIFTFWSWQKTQSDSASLQNGQPV